MAACHTKSHIGVSRSVVVGTSINAMTTQKRDNSVLFFVLGVIATLVGLIMVLSGASAYDDSKFLIGLVVLVVGIVLLVLAIRQYMRNIRTVSAIVVGAAAKLNNAPSTASLANEIARLTELHRSGSLTDDEYAAAKAKALGG